MSLGLWHSDLAGSMWRSAKIHSGRGMATAADSALPLASCYINTENNIGGGRVAALIFGGKFGCEQQNSANVKGASAAPFFI